MKNHFLKFVFVFGIFLNCKTTQVEDPVPNVTLVSSFNLIQDQIITPSCATVGCHASQTDNSFKQHGLVLAKGVAYNNLINKAVKNNNAIAEGLVQVKPFESAKSLFFHKLNWQTGHHVANYGSPMPLGSKSLYVGQIEYIRRWIEAGAPEKGEVADVKLLDDKTEVVVDNTFIPLEVPASGKGFQLKIDRFEVAPNFEREIFVHKEIGNKETIYVNAFELKSRTNSHHMVIYDFANKQLLPPKNTVRDLRNADNSVNLLTALSMSNHVFLGGGSDSQQEYVFPEGTALELPAGASVDLNPHYFNRTNKVQYGENYVNFYIVDKAKVQNVVKVFNLNNTDIKLLAGETKTFTKSWTYNEANKVVMLTSHMHELGTKFIIRIKGGARDGQIIYETSDWEHPLVKNFDVPLVLNKGEGLTSEVTYKNTTDKTVQFGLTSKDEMNIIFGYYYPIK